MTLTARAHLALFSKLAAAGTSYALAVALARAMTVEDFGRVALFLNAAALFSVLGAVGQQIALLRFVPALADARQAATLFRRSARLSLAGALIMVALVAALTAAGGGTGPFAGLTPGVVAAGLALIPAVAAMDILSHHARALHRTMLSLWPKEIGWRGVTALVVVAAAWRGVDVTVPLVTGTLLIAAALAVLFLLWRLGRQNLTGRRAVGADVMARWRRARVPFWISSVSNIFLANADVFAVGLWLGPVPAGQYFAANRLSMLLYFPVISHNTVIAPAMAAARAGGRAAEFAAIVRSAAVRAGWPTLAGSLGLASLAPLGLSVFGPDYAAAAPALQLLCLAAAVNAAGGPADLALNMGGQEAAAMRANAATLVAGAGLLVAGTLTHGITGAAGAVAAGTALRKLVFWWLALRLLGLRADMFQPIGKPRNHWRSVAPEPER